ncbi:MAG: 50S ribosomal protein L9 [Clostridiales bacterium]|jgi:large subunit ribosomal protein L9|nr:50S ribosomal protein L9 [Clostridiales bacterium]
MKVILNADVNGQGKKGDIIEVSEGFARNYLLPKKLAAEASASALNEAKQKVEAEKRRIENEKQNALSVAEKLKNQTVEVRVKCGEGKIYGSVTSKEIADVLNAKGFNIDKRQIVLKEIIKALGKFDVEIKLYPGINAKVTLEVVKE